MRFDYRTKFSIVFLSLTIGLTALVFGVHILVIWKWNKSQVEKYVDNAIYRAELLVDYTILRIREAPEISDNGCNAETLNNIRQAAYRYGVIQNVRVQTKDVECWAFGNSNLRLGDLISSSPRMPAENPDYSLFVLDSAETGSLAIEWKETENTTVTVTVSIAQILYDILPPEIRDNADIHIRLNNSAVIAIYSPLDQKPGRYIDTETFKAASVRYPLQAELHISQSVLWNWNRSYPPLISGMMLAALAGVSFFVTRGIVRDKGFAGELDAAIARKEIRPFYQPIINLMTGEIAGFEMLARWIKPDGQMVMPSKFIPFAEETGRIDAITNLLLQTSGEEIGSLLRDAPDLKLTFNITPEQYLADDFAVHLVEILSASRIPLTSAVVEVTERQSISDNEKSVLVSAQLKSAGIRIAIDDAGTGHNGLSSIHSLDAQYLKIDKYFVDALFLDNKSRTIVEMLTSVAKEFGMSVVAEGVETLEQAKDLASIGIQEGQGYYFSRPVPASSLKSMIENKPFSDALIAS